MTSLSGLSEIDKKTRHSLFVCDELAHSGLSWGEFEQRARLPLFVRGGMVLLDSSWAEEGPAKIVK